MTTTLTKTERKVLVIAAEGARGGIAATQTVGHGSRTVAAIRSLAAKGLLDDVSSYCEWSIRRGRTTLYRTTTAFITEAGRKALED